MKFLTAFALLVTSLIASAQPVLPATHITFNGNAAIEMVRTGMTTQTIRLSDRTAAPSSYKVGAVLAVVNSNQTEETRTPEVQVAANAYKFIELTKLEVKKLTDLSPADQAEFRRFYTQEVIDRANGIVTVVTFKYRATR